MKTHLEKLREKYKLILNRYSDVESLDWGITENLQDILTYNYFQGRLSGLKKTKEAILKDEMDMLDKMQFMNVNGNTARELIREDLKQLLKGEEDVKP